MDHFLRLIAVPQCLFSRLAVAGRHPVLLLLLVFTLAPVGEEAEAQPYRLQPGDVIEITVIEDPNLNRRVLVGPDGRISVPLAGTIPASGRTLEQVQAAIRGRLAPNFTRPPTVTASLIALAPPPLPEAPEPEPDPVIFSVFVLGEVPNPGRFDYDGEKPMTVLQALALAGGPGVFAARDRIQVRTLDDNGIETVQILDYEAIEAGFNTSLTGAIPDGAVIIVPERGLFD